MPPARYANAPIALISLNYNLNYERAVPARRGVTLGPKGGIEAQVVSKN